MMHVMMHIASHDASLVEAQMKAITLRNLPPELALRIEQEAKRSGASLNATVIRLLQQALAPEDAAKAPQRFRDLDHLASTWTKEEADEFDKYLADSRRIDVELQRLEWQTSDDAA